MSADQPRPSMPGDSDRPETNANGSSLICKSSLRYAPDDFCGKPATVPVTVACVHEHVRSTYACPEHAPQLGTHRCGQCYRADGHLCTLVLLAVAS